MVIVSEGRFQEDLSPRRHMIEERMYKKLVQKHIQFRALLYGSFHFQVSATIEANFLNTRLAMGYGSHSTYLYNIFIIVNNSGENH